MSDLWSQAFEDLDASDRQELQSHLKQPKIDPSDIFRVVADKKIECEKKQWILFTNKDGKNVYIRDVVTKVSNWVDNFIKVGDAAVQYDPAHAALPWAGVRLLLKLTINDCQIFGSLLEHVETISSIIARYTAMETRVLIRVSTLTKQLSCTLRQLYGAVLRFQAYAHRYYSTSTIKRAFKGTIMTAQTHVEEPMLAIERREAEVYKLFTLVQNECTSIKLDDILESLERSSNGNQLKNEERRRRLLTWINGIDTRNTYETALHYHHDGTCTWLLDVTEFQDWQGEDTSQARLLWIHGPAGFGKTFLTAWIVEHLKSQKEQPLAYFFCVADNRLTRDPHAILRGWLTQMVEHYEIAFRVLNSAFIAGDREHSLTYLELWELFVTVGDCIAGCTFVVDGFDECTDIDFGAQYHRHDARNYFLRDLLLNLAKTKARVLICSRDVPDIREVISKSTIHTEGVQSFEYQITAKDTTADVRSFSEFIVNERIPKKKPVLRQEIAEQAAERSEGMFLWIKLLESEISPGQNAKELKNAVQEMPSGISQAYSRELERIAQSSPAKKAKAVMILKWVLFAVRPLLVKELAEALVVSDEDLEDYPDVDDLPDAWEDTFVDEDYVNEMILGRCGSLLQLRPKTRDTALADQTVHFVHFSVKEYMLRLCREPGTDTWASSLGLMSASSEEIRLSNICLRYLNFNIFDEIPQDTLIYPFLSYAAWAWYFHSFHKRLAPPSRDILERTQSVFDPKVSKWRVWTPLMEAKLTEREHDEYRAVDSHQTSETSERSSLASTFVEESVGTLLNTVQNPIYYASLLGLVDVVKWLEDQGLDCNCTGGLFGFPLQAAVARNHDEVVKYLLDHKVNVQQGGGIYGCAINSAAAVSNLKIVKLLLESGADITAPDENKWIALHHAVNRGAMDIVQCLLEHGADIDATTEEGLTPMFLACDGGYKKLLSVLLERGADPQLMSRYGQTPFEQALGCGHEDMAWLLVDYMPFTNISSISRTGPLHMALQAGSLKLAQKLLNKGVNVNQPDSSGWTALHVAVYKNDIDTVKFLLNAGADVSFCTQNSASSLQIAASNNSVSMIKLLADHGAEIDQTTLEGSTALISATWCGSFEAVEALLSLGASIQGIHNSDQQTLFDTAILGRRPNRRDDIASALMVQGCLRDRHDENTAKLVIPNSTITTDIHLPTLSFKGDINAVNRCLQSDTHIVQDIVLNESLRIASARGHLAIVQALLNSGASVAAVDINGRNALHYATRHMHEEVADVLVTKGADILAQDDIGSTPIDLAICQGSMAGNFIHKHMGELTLGIIRRPSLLEAVGESRQYAPPDITRKLISGVWEGHYEYLAWEEGRQDTFSITIPTPGADDSGPNTFSNVNEYDEAGEFQYHGFVDQIGVIWFVKLYKAHGWLYRGQLNAKKNIMKGTWGSNRKLWFGTFHVRLRA